MDDEEVEMKNLREAKQYSAHVEKFGKRDIDNSNSGENYLSQFLPTSFGKKRKVEFNEEALKKTKKKKVQPAVPVEKSKKPKGPDPWYVFGKNMPPEPEPKKVEEPIFRS